MKESMQEEVIWYKETLFTVFMIEKGSLFDPWKLGLLSEEQKRSDYEIIGSYRIEEFVLYLDSITAINRRDNTSVKKENLHISLNYTGSMLLSRELLDAYEESRACYGYKKFLELIFVQGRLRTCIDHSRSMYRIRKNLETGLRDMSNSKDARCILHFIDELFVGKYKESIRERYYRSIKNGFGRMLKRIEGIFD